MLSFRRGHHRTPDELLSLRGLGRLTLDEARVLLERHLGTTWEAAHAAVCLSVGVEPRAQRPDVRLDAVLQRLAAHDLDHPLTRVLPGAVARRALQRGLERLGDFVRLPFAEIAELAGGTVMLERTLASLARAAEAGPTREVDEPRRPAPPPSPLRSIRLEDHADWRSVLRATLARLPDLEGRILARRAGFDGAPLRFRATRAELGISGERARRLEREARDAIIHECPWVPAMALRLDTARTKRWVMVSEVERADPIFEGATALPHAFAYVANRILLGASRVVAWRQGLALTAAEDVTLDIEPIRHTLLRAARALPFPIEEAALLPTLASATGIPPGDVEACAPFVERGCQREASRIVGFGEVPPVLLALRDATEPVSVRALLEEFGLGARRPLRRDAVWTGPGTVIAASRIPHWSEWCERLARLCREIMAEVAPEREWLTHELYEALRDRDVRLAEWINAWSLWCALRHRGEVRVVGRNVVALPHGDGRDPSRPRGRYASALTRRLRACLERSGGPMSMSAAREMLRRRRGMRHADWAFAIRNLPVVWLDPDTLGLSPRDVPGGEEAIEKVMAEIVQRAEASPEGLDAEAIGEAVRAAGLAWTVELARSFARSHPRLRVTNGRRSVRLARPARDR